MIERHGKSGRPRSDRAKTAVLQSADNLLVEEGYAAMTLKGIAERAGVSRQTIYRWWSTKAEILFEASVEDAQEELAIEPGPDIEADLVAYLDALVRFLSVSPSGAAYRALLGEAQHDADVARLMATNDILGASARAVVEPALLATGSRLPIEEATAFLIGPAFYLLLSGHEAAELDTRQLAQCVLAILQNTSAR